jgi:hypothetical protein
VLSCLLSRFLNLFGWLRSFSTLRLFDLARRFFRDASERVLCLTDTPNQRRLKIIGQHGGCIALRPMKLSRGEVSRTDQARAAKICACQVRAGKVGAVEKRVSQIRTEQIGTL